MCGKGCGCVGEGCGLESKLCGCVGEGCGLESKLCGCVGEGCGLESKLCGCVGEGCGCVASGVDVWEGVWVMFNGGLSMMLIKLNSCLAKSCAVLTYVSYAWIHHHFLPSSAIIVIIIVQDAGRKSGVLGWLIGHKILASVCLLYDRMG